MSRRTAIKKRCLDCVGFSYKDRENCDMIECPLWPYRLGECEKGKSIERNLAIKQFCSSCCYDTRQEVINCPCETCSLYPYKAFTAQKVGQ